MRKYGEAARRTAMPAIMSTSSTTHRTYSFGEFTLDVDRGTLNRAGADIKLRPNSFEVLSYLASHHGVLVTKAELLDTVWRGAAVTDDSLTQCIIEIRRAIRDTSRTIIRTVPKRGFIFDLPVSESTDLPPGRRTRFGDFGSPTTWTWISAAAAVAVITLIVLQFELRDEPIPTSESLHSAPHPNSIAVLAFVDMSEQQDQQYFGDGVAEEILSQLTEYSELQVVARTSSFLFRDKDADVSAIGRQLNVAHVLEGSIRKSGNRLRIVAQLIETEGATHVWSQSFDRELTVQNVLDIQTEVAASVAKAIGSGATAGSRQLDPTRSTANTEAYDLYLEGMYYLRHIETSLRTIYPHEFYKSAISRFEASIASDSTWAVPHAALGKTMHFYADRLDGAEASERFGLAKQHLIEAIRLDPNNAGAYSSLGYVQFRWDFDFSAAAASYARALDLGGYSPWGYAIFLRGMGRFDDAIEQFQLAIERDPLSAGPRHQLATTYRCAGRYSESIAELETVVQLAPDRKDVHIEFAYLHLKYGNYEKGRAIFDQYAEPEKTAIPYGSIYFLLGMVDQAYEVLRIAESDQNWRVADVVSTSLILGEEERALAYLEAAAEAHPRNLINLHCIEGIQSLADSPRFQRLLRSAGQYH